MEYFNILHNRAIEVVTRYKNAEAEFIEILQEMDKTKSYLEFNYTSLFDYCVKGFGLTEDVTLNFINVSRKAVQIPELKAAIIAGELTVPKARKITSVITPESQSDWISKATTLSSRALEKEVAKVRPQELTPERTKYVREDRINLNFGLSEEFFNKLKRVQNLESQRRSKAVNLEETLEAMINLYLEKKDPLEKAKRNIGKSAMPVATMNSRASSVNTFSIPVTGHVDNLKFSRTPIQASLRHQVNMRDQGKCTKNGCNQQRWLDIHHGIPVSQGGTNALENLKTLCSTHHRMEHAKGLENF